MGEGSTECHEIRHSDACQEAVDSTHRAMPRPGTRSPRLLTKQCQLMANASYKKVWPSQCDLCTTRCQRNLHFKAKNPDIFLVMCSLSHPALAGQQSLHMPGRAPQRHAGPHRQGLPARLRHESFTAGLPAVRHTACQAGSLPNRSELSWPLWIHKTPSLAA